MSRDRMYLARLALSVRESAAYNAFMVAHEKAKATYLAEKQQAEAVYAADVARMQTTRKARR